MLRRLARHLTPRPLRLLPFAVCLGGLLSGTARADLLDYVRKPDKSYQWEKRSVVKNPQGTVATLHLVSQTWQGMAWEHALLVYAPPKVEYPGAAVLVITGGNPGGEDAMLGPMLARATGVPVAILFNIPNQPLFGGKQEDDLIAHTFEDYLKSGDTTWPLLFPMTKSAVRAMDALQAWSQEEKQNPLSRFIVTGASKRGWTTWLTAATGDPRVAGIIPMVYDNLNLAAQMPHQIEQWGRYSEMIEDYTRRGLQQKMTTPEGKKLGAMVDPWTFRKALTVPKLIVNGTNDPYWAQDALNLYWRDLPGGQNWILYAPNSGHGLENRLPVLSAAVAFTRAVASRQYPYPLRWQYEPTAEGMHLSLTAPKGLTSARLWTARSDTQDFRKARWESAPMKAAGQGFAADVARPASGWLAVFGEGTMEHGGRTFPASTQVQILAPTK